MSWPTNGSVMILNAKAENFSLSAAALVVGVPSSFSQSTGGTSKGEGKKSTTASNMA